MSIAVFYITEGALRTAERIKNHLKDTEIVRFNQGAVKRAWEDHSQLIFVMAAGIVTRTIAPLLDNKKNDPPVVIVDEAGKYVISLLSGHLGGANELAERTAKAINAEPVLTTSTDINHLTAPDLWAKEKHLLIENPYLIPKVTTRFINNGALRVFIDNPLKIDLPEDYLLVDPPFADLLITNKASLNLCGCKVRDQLIARPKNLYVGIGCNKGTTIDEIEEAIKRVFSDANLSVLSIAKFATIDIKTKEEGLKNLAKKMGVPLVGFPASRLNDVKNVSVSEAAKRATGAQAVAEPAALLASKNGELIVNKVKSGNLTIAIAQTNTLTPCISKLSVIGTGPGLPDYMTAQAKRTLQEAEIIVGYDTYIEQIKPLINEKVIFSTGMTEERQRCAKAVEMALSGKNVAVVSGGDPGIYAMAGLVLELLKDAEDSGKSFLIEPSELETEIIPGLSALNACASRLGAPLMHDFASISLSDRLTRWEVIEKRINNAAEADFVIVLYNPKSKGRAEHINRARDIIAKHRHPDTPVGIVKGAMRENEDIIITNLKEMLNHEIDMQTTVIIGNSQSYVWNNYIITPRGYQYKKD